MASQWQPLAIGGKQAFHTFINHKIFSNFRAFGVILFELLTGKRPFSDESEYLLYKRILRLDYTFPDDFTSEEARQLITQLLVICPEERLGSIEKGGALRIREEPFFAGMDWTNLAQQKSPLFPTEDEPSGPKGRDEEDNN